MPKVVIFEKANENLDLNVFFLANLVDNFDITLEDKLEHLKILYAQQVDEVLKEVVEDQNQSSDKGTDVRRLS